MDLTQRKLNKAEWESIEVPVAAGEQQILELIKAGYHNPAHTISNGDTLLSFTKLENSESMELYLFVTYFRDPFVKLYKKHGLDRKIKVKENAKFKPKKRDIIRIDNNNHLIEANTGNILEFVLLDVCRALLKEQHGAWLKHYYTLATLTTYGLSYNKYVGAEIDFLLAHFAPQVSLSDVIRNAVDYVEKNTTLHKFQKTALFDHQRQLFQLFAAAAATPKLVFYVAPTGTGKTLSPLGLSENYRVIFVCAARHIGLALAKSAISAHKKIALAFNCEDSEQIRLHFAAAKDFTRNRRTGGIHKVDNSVGDNVEIIISDIKSYLVAMRYMTAFNSRDRIITYWDEPTITMDYETHPFHEIIQQNWRENTIPNIVLSSATLPHPDEIGATIADYRSRFDDGSFVSIVSADCNNSVPLVNKEGYVTLPHHIYSNYSELTDTIRYCKSHSSLIRYMDLGEIARFVSHLNTQQLLTEAGQISAYFDDIRAINARSLKEYYLDSFRFITPGAWGGIYTHFQADAHRRRCFESAMYVMTKDAHTITHGPCIYLTHDIEKIAKFCLQHAKIPPAVIGAIAQTVESNRKLGNEIHQMEEQCENLLNKDLEKEKKMSKMTDDDDDGGKSAPGVVRLRNKISMLESRIRTATMPPEYTPNTYEHTRRWCGGAHGGTAGFKPSISEEHVIRLMKLSDIDDMWKILLLMGVGSFTNHKSVGYTEIMKELAEEQKLMMIIASSDYIYGTNYQFCHGYIGKDLGDLTQEKLIQALGRVGRRKNTLDYSIRFRDNTVIEKIFKKLDVKLEAQNMNALFS